MHAVWLKFIYLYENSYMHICVYIWIEFSQTHLDVFLQ